jgi:NAD-dependent deacetylase
MDEKIRALKEMIDNSENIVFFGGAGVSTESGIPDFRSTDGLYHHEWKFSPETILSHTFYECNPEEFFRFYRAKMLARSAKPNAAHRKLAEWEQQGKLKAVITQNIDGLHQAAGSHSVLELHGSVLRNYCERCRKFYDMEFVLQGSSVPRCS